MRELLEMGRGFFMGLDSAWPHAVCSCQREGVRPQANRARQENKMLQIATLDPHTKGLVYENGEEIDEISLDFYSESRSEWQRLADERIQEAGYRRVSDWADTDLGNTATIVRA